jgi:hypothetical protein
LDGLIRERFGWLDPGAVKRWWQGQVDYLERVVQTNLSRISMAMKLFRSWATAKGLIPSETSYVARTPSRQTLRFSKSGTPTIERLYRTLWLSGELTYVVEFLMSDGEVLAIIAAEVPHGVSGTNSPYGIRFWKCLSARVSPAGTFLRADLIDCGFLRIRRSSRQCRSANNPQN